MQKLTYALFTAFLATANISLAQGINFSGSSDEPIEVFASDGIELHQKEQKVIANKDALATRGNASLAADKIEGFYRKGANKNTEIWKLNAIGNVKMTSDKSTASGNNASYDIDSNTLVLFGTPAHFVSEGDHVTADKMEYLQNKKIVHAIGNAKVVRANNTLTSNTLSAKFIENKSGKLEVSLMNAEGNVVISTQTEKATGNKASYNPKTGIAVLFGNVKLTKDDNYLEGEKATVNMKTGVSKLFAGKSTDGAKPKQVHGVFLPKNKKDVTPK